MEQIEAALDTLTIDNPDMLKDALAYISKAQEGKAREHKAHTAELKTEHTNIENKLDRLTELRIEGELTKQEFAAQKKKLKDRQIEIVQLIKAYDITDDEFTNKLIYMVELASNAVEEFRSSEFQQKRELLQYVFQNLQMDGKKLVFTMNKPFDTITKCVKTGKWCTEEDSNL